MPFLAERGENGEMAAKKKKVSRFAVKLLPDAGSPESPDAGGIDGPDGLDAPERARVFTSRERQFFRRFNSEKHLEECLPWEWEPGAAYHIISHGDIDGLTFFKFALRQQVLRYALLSTWCMALIDIRELERYIGEGRIGRLDSYVGEIFRSRYMAEWAKLCALHEKHGGRAAIFRNHSKIFLGFGDKFDFVIESSANINTNPRTENTVITINSRLARHYKNFFDGITGFTHEFDGWKPYSIEEVENGESEKSPPAAD
jgi:hypothetical protein